MFFLLMKTQIIGKSFFYSIFTDQISLYYISTNESKEKILIPNISTFQQTYIISLQKQTVSIELLLWVYKV